MVGMKKIAAFIMAGAIVVSGISVPATVRAESIPIRENISDTPASGNIIIGVEGYDYTSAQKELLDMVNAVRKKACDEGDPDPRDTSRKLTSSDYVPIKLGVNCTKAAILRAAEGAVYLGHTRPNGGSWFQILNHYNSSSGSGGENLAWGSDNASRIQGWIDERAAWIDPSVSGQTGHYESLINPKFKYTGMATFNPTNDNAPYNWACTSGEYASSDTELTSYEEAQNKLVLQKMEVKIDNVTETELSGDSALYVGDKGSMSMLVSVTYSGVRDNTTTGCKVYTPGKWKSTDTSVLTVDEDTGSITAKGVGSAKVSCTVTSGDKSISAEKEVVVLPNGVTVEELVNPETITINTGTKPDMPKTVKALLSNGETINVGVTWEDIPNDYNNSKSYSYYQETTFDVKGTFQSYEVYQPIHVIPQIDYFVLEKDTVTVDCGTKPTYPKATYIYLTNHVYYSNETLTWNDNEAYKNRSGGEYEVEGTFSFNKTKKAKVTLIVNPMAKKSVKVSTDDITVVSGHKPVLPKAHVIWADDEETDEEIAWVEDDDFNNGYNKEAGYTYTVSGSYGGEDYSVKVNVVDCFHKSLTTHEAKAATCEENGNILYYSCDDCGSLFLDSQASTEISLKDTVLNKTGHSFGTAEYTWSETSPVVCTAAIACVNDGCTKTISEKAKPTGVEVEPPTCTEKGKTKYTAAFTDEHFTAQSKIYEDIEALGHDYDTPEYIWSEDGSSCEATRVCKNDTTHIEKENAVITSKVKREATCIRKGATEYTATFTNKAFNTQSKVIEDIPLGTHKGGTATCIAKAVCEECGEEYGDIAPDNHVNCSVKNAKEDIILTDNTTGTGYVVISTDDNTPALAYDGPGKVTGTVIVPDKITVDGESYKVTVISQEAFKGEEALTAVKIGDNIETIEDGAFENCSNLKTVTLGKNVKTIGESAFNGCSKLKEIKIGDKVTSIEECAFKGCTSLKKITIPAKVKKIGDNAFANTKSLKTILIKSRKLTTKTISSKAFKGIGKKVTIKVPKSKRKAYKKLFVKKGLSKKVKIK